MNLNGVFRLWSPGTIPRRDARTLRFGLTECGKGRNDLSQDVLYISMSVECRGNSRVPAYPKAERPGTGYRCGRGSCGTGNSNHSS
jgi:hypothetical protein